MTLFSAQYAEELRDLANDLPYFIDSIELLAKGLGLELTKLEVDHIALRCHQTATAERWKRGFMQHGTLFSEKEINGRPVALFELALPINVGPWQVSMVELPWPGHRLYRHEGWEHVEVVLRGDADKLGARALALCTDEGLTQQGISIRSSAPKGAGERLSNPTLAISDGNVTIKFHPWSLKEVIESELK